MRWRRGRDDGSTTLCCEMMRHTRDRRRPMRLPLLLVPLGLLLAWRPVSAQPSTTYEWTRVATVGAGSPGARDQHALGYDQRRNRLIVFGGGGGLADTWAFNLTSGVWTQLSTPSAPEPRFSMVYGMDQSDGRDRFIVAIGEGPGKVFYNDVWALSLSPGAETWTRLCGADCVGAPAPRYGAAGGTWLFGSRWLLLTHGFSGSRRFADSFAFDLSANAWVALDTDNVPHARCLLGGAVLQDLSLVIQGGCGSGGYGPCPARDTWRLRLGGSSPSASADGAWTELSGCPRPVLRPTLTLAPGQSNASLAAQRLLLFGGSSKPYGSDPAGSVGVLDVASGGWTLVRGQGAALPAARQGHAAVYVNALADRFSPDDYLVVWGGTGGDDAVWALRAVPGEPATFACPTIFDLRLLHGLCMGLGWGVLLPLGATAARFRGELQLLFGSSDSALWFKIHRPLQAVGILLGVGGFIAAVFMVPANPFSAQPHATIGIIVTALGVLQPLNALFRPHPEPRTRARAAWELLHKYSGRAALLLGLANIFQGLVYILAPLWARALYYLWFGCLGLGMAQVLFYLLLTALGRPSTSPVAACVHRCLRGGRAQAAAAAGADIRLSSSKLDE